LALAGFLLLVFADTNIDLGEFMKATFGIFSVLLSATLMLASSQAIADDAYEEAYLYCKKTPTFTLEKSCFSAIRSRGFFERAVLEVCKTANTWETTIECLRAGAGQTDPEAAVYCGKAQTWELTIKCLSAIADKQYISPERDDCIRYTTWQGTIDCFQESGRHMNGCAKS